MERIMTSLGLTLNAEKTRIVDAAEGFNFLGMHFCLKPMRSIRHKIWDAIGHDDLYSLQEKIRAISPILTGLRAVLSHQQRPPAF
jgi:hypothetical protein